MLRLIVALMALASAASAQECTELTTPLLCGSENINIDLDECNSSTIAIPEMKPCCRLQSEQLRKCDDPEATQACRSIEISSGLCPGESQENCCFRKEMSMRFYFEFNVANKTCCSKCRCYGDPHCESFDGTPDTWVLCDARTPQPGRPDRCPMSRAMCNRQLDHTGRACNWTQTGSASNWNIGLQGSPCVPNNSPQPASMVMYETDGFKITLNMGERSVIKHVLIEDDANTYVLGADDCFTAAYSPTPTNPWRLTASVGQTPPNMPADWLPYKWAWGPLDGEDIMWNVDGLGSLVDMSIRCTRTVVLQNGRRRFGPPRLNVDIVEPLNWRDNDQRPDASGFCPSGRITKQGSTANTDQITARNWCTNDVDLLDIARFLCGSGTTAPGVENCKANWCRLPNDNKPARPQSQITQCMSDVNTLGWDVTYCATMLLPSPVNAADCNNDPTCRTCVTDIRDFGWPAAIAKYSNGASGASECVTRDDLPPDLTGLCTKGVRIEYFDSRLNQWIPYIAIPEGTCLQDGYITFTSSADEEMFLNPIRIRQCSEPKGSCLTNKCATEIGFTAKIELDVTTSTIEKVYNLFEAGLLICDPKIWPDPQDCLGFTPEKMCPCPNRRLNELPASGKREIKYIPQ